MMANNPIQPQKQKPGLKMRISIPIVVSVGGRTPHDLLQLFIF